MSFSGVERIERRNGSVVGGGGRGRRRRRARTRGGRGGRHGNRLLDAQSDFTLCKRLAQMITQKQTTRAKMCLGLSTQILQTGNRQKQAGK